MSQSFNHWTFLNDCKPDLFKNGSIQYVFYNFVQTIWTASLLDEAKDEKKILGQGPWKFEEAVKLCESVTLLTRKWSQEQRWKVVIYNWNVAMIRRRSWECNGIAKRVILCIWILLLFDETQNVEHWIASFKGSVYDRKKLPRDMVVAEESYHISHHLIVRWIFRS